MAQETKVQATNEEIVQTPKVKKEKKEMSTNTLRTLAALKALLLALIIGVILIIATGQADALGDFFIGFFDTNFSSMYFFTDFLAKMSYLIPLGLALAVSFRIGLFNIGAAGQALAGGSIAYYIGAQIDFGQLGWIMTILIGVSIGAFIAFLIAFLKNKFNINEVISSIMLNWMVFYFIRFLVTSNDASTILINANNDLNFDWLYSVFGEAGTVSSSINIGMILVIPLIAVLWWAYNKTKWGFKQDVIGSNKNAGSYLGVDYKKEVYKAMIISGALAGFAGVIYQCGLQNPIMSKGAGDIPAWTFDGITIALLGFNSPIGIIFSSAIFALFNPTIDVDIIGNYGILSVVVAMMIIFISASNYRITYGKRRRK